MVFGAIRRAFIGALTGVIENWERRKYRNVALPPGFVLPSKRGMGGGRDSAGDSDSTQASLMNHNPSGRCG